MKKIKNLFLNLFLAIFLFSTRDSFAQEKKKEIVAYHPSLNISKVIPTEFKVENSADYFEKKIASKANYLKNSFYYSRFLFLLALRKEDISYCNTCANKDEFSKWLEVRYLGEGRCSDIKNLFFKEICTALKNNNCDSLKDWQKSFCQAIVTEDIPRFNNVINLPKFREDMHSTFKCDISCTTELFAFYSGFKHYSANACEKFMKDQPLHLQLDCDILFTSDVDSKVGSLVTDMAIFDVSKESSNTELCGRIVNQIIKKACLKPKIRSLFEIW